MFEDLKSTRVFRYNNRFYRIDDILFDESPKSKFFDSRTNAQASFI